MMWDALLDVLQWTLRGRKWLWPETRLYIFTVPMVVGLAWPMKVNLCDPMWTYIDTIDRTQVIYSSIQS